MSVYTYNPNPELLMSLYSHVVPHKLVLVPTVSVLCVAVQLVDPVVNVAGTLVPAFIK